MGGGGGGGVLAGGSRVVRYLKRSMERAQARFLKEIYAVHFIAYDSSPYKRYSLLMPIVGVDSLDSVSD